MKFLTSPLPFTRRAIAPRLRRMSEVPGVQLLQPLSTHRSPIEAQSGIALIVVMISIFVLTILAGGFAFSMKIETKLARNANNETELEWLGRSGVEYARYIIAEQAKIASEPYQALNQVWAGGPGGPGTTNSPLALIEREPHLGNGSFTWKITDLASKFNVNNLNDSNQGMLQEALIHLGLDAGEMTPVVNSILDWLDVDSNPHIDGAETDFYQTQNPPYRAKDGPIDDLSELLMIRGVSREMFWGSASSNHTLAAFQNVNRFSSPTDASSFPVGFMDVFTPFSSGKINLNTAPPATLQMLPGVDANIADAIIAARSGEDDGNPLTGPFRNVDANYLFNRVPGLSLPLARAMQPFVDIRNRTYEVQVDAKINGYERHFVAILGFNNPRDVQVLLFYSR